MPRTPIVAATLAVTGGLPLRHRERRGGAPDRAHQAMNRHLRAARAALVLLASATLSCQSRPAPPAPPEEKWLVVTSNITPLLRKVTDTADPHDVLRKGELAKYDHDRTQLRWSGKIEGEKATREGTVFELRYAAEGMILHGFKPDFAAEMSVPVTSWLCDTIAQQGTFDAARCPGLLRRAKTADGGVVVYMACASGPCPVGLYRGGHLSVVFVEGITNARYHAGNKRSLLLAETRWSKDDGKQSGGSFVPIVLEGDKPLLQDPIPADRIDARDLSKIAARTVQSRVTATEIVMTGEETVKSADGATVTEKKIDERHPLPAL